MGLHDEDRTPTFVADVPQRYHSGIERLEPNHGRGGTDVRVVGTNLHY